jgi:serine/threonine protein kinase
VNDDFERLEMQRRLHSEAGSKDFGRFVLHQRIGKGAMGIVFRATQKALDCTRAVKILNPEMIEDKELVARFEGEARSAARLAHQNIVQVIDCGWHEGHAFIAMEYVEGNNLEEWLDPKKELGSPPLEIALLMFRDVCRGLEHAHKHGIVHRDIKPANIMITPEGIIKIMDFGLARHTKETIRRTMHGEVLGTPAYMSPEQAQGENVDHRSDIFSAGIVAYELLCGERPFAGETYSTVRHSILTQEPRRLQKENPLVPTEVAAIVHKMLQKDPARRYPSMAPVLSDLEVVIEGMGLSRSREWIRRYVTDPVTVSQDLRARRLKLHLDQGVFFENMGRGKIEDAILEFQRVLKLDPSNRMAKEHLKKLESERQLARERDDDPLKTRPYDPASSPVPGSAPVHRPAADLPRAEPVSPTMEPRVEPGPPPRPAPKDDAQPSKGLLLVAVFGLLLTLIAAPFVLGWIPSGRSGTLAITTNPPDASVVVDGGAPRRGGDFRGLNEGSHTVRVSRDGYEPQERSVGVRKGRRETVAFSLKPRGETLLDSLQGGPPAAEAKVRVRTIPPGARVFLDGTELPGITDRTFQRITPGTYRLRLELKGYEPLTRQVTISGAGTSVVETLKPAQDVQVGSIKLTLPPGTKIWIDGYPREPGSGRFREIRVGSHTLRAERPGYHSIERTFEVAAGVETTVPPLPWQVLPNSSGTLKVKVRPYATLTVNGVKRGENQPSYEVPLEAGKRYDIQVSHPTFGSKRWTDVEIDPGDTVTKDHDFTKYVGGIRIQSDTWAYIILDGEQMGNRTSPFVLPYIPEGKHTVALSRPGYEAVEGTQTVQVAGGDTISVKFQLRKK